MKTAQKICSLILLFFTVSLILNSCNNSNNTNTNNKESLTIIPVEASHVNRGDISAFYSATATLEAEEEATIVSKVRGIVDEIYVEEGDEVKAGEIIARIEIDQYRIEAERARATMNRLENDYNRNKKLFERSLISEETYQNVQFELESQRAAYELAELNLANTAIKSPISGVISERFVKKGNMIGADQQMFRVTDFNVLQAILHVPEHEMAIIRRGQPAELQVDALPGEIFEGRVERISPVVDFQSGTFKVTVQVNQSGQILRPGM
ncbi:MAG: efflux RND transporter periplasmic adaptor subunit, partial [Balneolaceae bacterium]